MPNLIDVGEVSRRILPIIYVIDISDLKNFECISNLNQTMHAITSMFECYYGDYDYDIRINVLSNAMEGKWMYNELQLANKFEWKELHTCNEADPTSLLEELNKKLSRSEMLKNDVGFCVPYIVLISDRTHASTVEWENTVERVTNGNKWFKYSNKLAISINDDTNIDFLLKFVKNIETIVPLQNACYVHSIMFKYFNLDTPKGFGEYLKECSASESSQEPLEDEGWGDWE